MNILVVDDEPLAVKRLSELIEQIPGCRNVGSASNGVEAVYKAYRLGIDVVLMDISLPRMNGLEAARHIREFDRPPMVVFTTAHSDHALEAFSVQATSYLMKPVGFQDLLEVVSMIQSNYARQVHEPVFCDKSEMNHICCYIDNELQLVPLNHVYYLESFKKHTRIVHKDGVSLTGKPLSDFAKEYPRRLMRIHRSTVINKSFLRRLRKIDGHYEIVLQDLDASLLVSRRHLPIIRRHLKSFMLSRKIVRQRGDRLNGKKPANH